MRTNEQSFEDRMKRGREYEASMIARLRADGHRVERASREHDKHEGVDITFNGFRAQLKRRESGDDIIVEVERPLGTLGRDAASHAQVFIEFRNDGSYTVVLAKPLIREALALAIKAKAKWGTDELTGHETYTDRTGSEVRCRRDAGLTGYASGALKIMAYIKHNAAYCRRFQ